jgi:hypothetical protein
VAAHSLGADAMGGVYVPRSPTTGVLYGVVRGHWSDFAAEVQARTDGVGLPPFVERLVPLVPRPRITTKGRSSEGEVRPERGRLGQTGDA